MWLSIAWECHAHQWPASERLFSSTGRQRVTDWQLKSWNDCVCEAQFAYDYNYWLHGRL